MKKSVYVLLTLLLIVSVSVSASQVSRWYSAELVAQGQQLFRDKCAACHGDNAEGVPDWRLANKEGEYPPPPPPGPKPAPARPANPVSLRGAIMGELKSLFAKRGKK